MEQTRKIEAQIKILTTKFNDSNCRANKFALRNKIVKLKHKLQQLQQAQAYQNYLAI